MIEKLNAIWEDRRNITPSYATIERPKVLDIYKLLPRTNCKECGVPTCMAYAAGLVEGNLTLEGCPQLQDEAWAASLGSLRGMAL
jgi:CO dehydrogenase/acetyl-CoA synthase gamma subunit (corrinoid Fe-S protein)